MIGCFLRKILFKFKMFKSIEDLNVLLDKLILEVHTMANELKTLQANVAALIATVKAEGDVVRAATLAIQGLTDQQTILSQQLQEAIDNSDPAAIQEVADAILAQNQTLIDQTAALAAAIPAVPPPAVG
jgi:hypothetical protein